MFKYAVGFLLILFVFSGCGSSSTSDDSPNIFQSSNDNNSTNTNQSNEQKDSIFSSDTNSTKNIEDTSNDTNNTDTNQTPTFDDTQREFLFSLFKDEYLWYEHVADSYEKVDEPQQMIDNLKYSTLDKWSFVETRQEYDDSQNQISGGYGCYFYGDKISLIDIDSPCDKAGFQRGDQFLKINGEPITSELFVQTKDNVGVDANFTVKRGNDELNITIAPLSSFTYKSMKSQLLQLSNQETVGLLIFNEFTSKSIDEMEEEFTYFKENNISELILDLRYNGGGNLITASILMDKIAGIEHEGKVQLTLKHNDKHSDKNDYLEFEKNSNSLTLNRIFVLTSEYTASASETIINSLKPYMDVVLIGEKTHGKPVGMTGREKNNYIYFLINFEVVNVNNEANFYDGINVDCIVDDKIDLPRIDKNEALLSEALHYIQNGNCK